MHVYCSAKSYPWIWYNGILVIFGLQSKSLHFWVQSSPDMFFHTQKLYFYFLYIQRQLKGISYISQLFKGVAQAMVMLDPLGSANSLKEPHVRQLEFYSWGPSVVPVHTCSHCPRRIQSLPKLFSTQLSEVQASNSNAGCSVGLSMGKYLHRVEH